MGGARSYLNMSPTVLIVVGYIIIGLAACAGVFGGYLAKLGHDQRAAASKLPNISFQKFALFWLQLDDDIYQLGAMTKLFNLDSKPYQINGITLDADNWSFFPRGGYQIRRFTENQDHAEVLEDNYIKAGNEAYFKKRLPIKLNMSIISGDTPEFVLRG